MDHCFHKQGQYYSKKLWPLSFIDIWSNCSNFLFLLPVWTLKVRYWWRNTPRWWLTWSCFVPLWHSRSSSGSSLSPSAPTLVSSCHSPVALFALGFVLISIFCGKAQFSFISRAFLFSVQKNVVKWGWVRHAALIVAELRKICAPVSWSSHA